MNYSKKQLDEAQALKQQLEDVRNNQKKISDFSSVQDWIEYAQDNALKKAVIFNAMEKVFAQ